MGETCSEPYGDAGMRDHLCGAPTSSIATPIARPMPRKIGSENSVGAAEP